jgi:hypothetical protein
MYRLRIHLNDEAPRIGTGHRIVEVTSRGPKWVTVRYAPKTIREKGQALDGHTRFPIATINHRFPVDLWKQLEKGAIVL